MKEGWEYKKLGDICDIINGKNQKTVENPNGIYPIMGSGGVMGYADNYLCKEGTTIIGRKGTINRPIYVDQKFWNVDTAFGLQPKDITNSKFLYYLCKSINFERYNKSVTIPSLVKSDLLKIDVRVPDTEEQQQIVFELDLLSGVVEKQKAQIEELDKLAQSIFYDMFGDLESNPYKFEIKSLDRVCLLKAGKSIRADELYDTPEGHYPCFGGNGVRGYIDRYSHEGIFPIIGRQGALCGNVNLANGKFYATEHAVVVSPKVEMDSLWLYYSLISMRLGQYAHGVAQPGLSVKDLNPLPFVIPPLSLQQEFAAKVEQIESMKAKVRQSLTEAETLFNSRMDYYFN